MVKWTVKIFASVLRWEHLIVTRISGGKPEKSDCRFTHDASAQLIEICRYGTKKASGGSRRVAEEAEEAKERFSGRTDKSARWSIPAKRSVNLYYGL